MDREQWLAKLKSDTTPLKYPKLDAKIRRHIKEKGSITIVEGALGDGIGLGAYVEDIIKTPDGLFTKFYGISYLYKGEIRADIIDANAQVKAVFMATTEFLIKNWFILPFVIFSKKSIIKWLAKICNANLRGKLPPYHHFSVFSRELIRVSCEILGVDIRADKVNDYNDLIYCLVSFLQYDNAYRLRFQDAMGELRKVGVIQAVREVFDIEISRENIEAQYNGQVQQKMIVLKKLVLFLLYVSPKARKFVKEFIEKIDIGKIKLDEADWYYCLRRSGYNYRGISYEDRLKIARQIDKERKHIILGL